MPDRHSQKELTDARAATSPAAETWGMATGEVTLDEPHAAPSAMMNNTGALYGDLAPFGSRAQVPTSGADDQG